MTLSPQLRAAARRRPISRALLTAMVIGLLTPTLFAAAPFLRDAETQARDIVQGVAYPALPATRDVAIIAIDEWTLAQFPYRSPVDREFLATLIESLAAKGPRAIGLDVLLDQPTEPAKDAALIETLTAPRAVPVFVAVADAEDGLTERQSAWLAEVVCDARVAHVALLRDRVGDVVRAVEGPRALCGDIVAPMSVALATAAGAAPPDATFSIAFARSRERIAPTYSAAFAADLPDERIRGRVVLIGTTLESVDRHVAPVAASDGARLTPGVEIHAQAVRQLLEGRSVSETGLGADILAALAASLAVAAALFAPGPPVAKTAAAGLAIAAAVSGPFAAIAFFGVRGPALSLASAALVTGVAVALRRWIDENSARRRLRRAFGRYLAPELTRRIASDPDGVRLDGERREMSFVFTDVAGFTSLSESMAPEDLTALLNRYLGGASRLFIDHGATIDKFIGDAVVGFFGAPVARDDHAEAALRLALALDAYARAFADEARAQGLPFGDTRIGVSSGAAVVGDLGGDQFFDYTAIGDVVNTAARLEGANKAFGTRVCVSAATAAAAAGAADIGLRPVGRIRLVGRARFESVHELFAPDPARAEADAAYRDAYALLASDPEPACAMFAALRTQWPRDPLIALHAARCAAGARDDCIAMKEK